MAEVNADEAVMQAQSDAGWNSVQTITNPPESSSRFDNHDLTKSNEALRPITPAPAFSEIKHTSTNVTTTSGGRPYSSFSSGEKWFIVVLSAVAGTFSSVSLTLT